MTLEELLDSLDFPDARNAHRHRQRFRTDEERLAYLNEFAAMRGKFFASLEDAERFFKTKL